MNGALENSTNEVRREAAFCEISRQSTSQHNRIHHRLNNMPQAAASVSALPGIHDTLK